MRTAPVPAAVAAPIPPTFLLVDDSTFDRLLLRTAFKRKMQDANLVEAATLDDARRYLEHGGADLIVVDNGMPDGSGVEFVRGIAADPRFADIPVVMISGGDCARLAPQAVEAGCSAVVSKSRINPATISDLIAEFVARRASEATEPAVALETEVVVDFSHTLSQKFAAPLSRALLLVRTARSEAQGGDTGALAERLDELEKVIFAVRSFIEEA